MGDAARYRQAERRYWEAEGVVPAEIWVDLPTIGSAVRIQVVGDGPPLLLVHGGSSCGTNWAPLVARLGDFRCLLLDRPGCGLSPPRRQRSHGFVDFARYAEQLLVDVLDALELVRADLVATSLGGYFALRSLAAHPARFGGLVELGFPIGAPLGPVPLVMRVASARGLGRLMARLPVSDRMARSMLRQIGLRQAMDAGRLPDEGVAWFRSMLDDTATMRNEIDGSPPVIRALRGANEAILLPDDVLGRVRAPTLFVWGSADPFGGRDVAEAFVARIPGAVLEMVEGGHAVWVDDPEGTAGAVRDFVLRLRG